MKRRTARKRVADEVAIALFAVTLSLSGCSFVFVQPPRDNEVRSGFGSCTSAPIAPLIDSVLTVTNLLSTLYVATNDNASNKDAAVLLGLSASAFWLSSAIYGFYETSRCSELESEDNTGPYLRPVPSRRQFYRGPGGPEFVAPPPPPPAPAPPPVRQRPDQDDPEPLR